MAFGPAPEPQQWQGGNGGGTPDTPGFDAARPYDPANPPAVGEWVRLSSGRGGDGETAPEEAVPGDDEVPTAPRVAVRMTVPVLLPLGTPSRAAAPLPDEPVTLVELGGMREALAAAEARAIVAAAPPGPGDRPVAHQEFSPLSTRGVNPGAVVGITALIIAVLVGGGWVLYAGRPSSTTGPDGATTRGMSVPATAAPPVLTPPPLTPSPAAVVTPAHGAAPSVVTVPSAVATPPSPMARPATGTPTPTPAPSLARTPPLGPAGRKRPTPPPTDVRRTAAPAATRRVTPPAPVAAAERATTARPRLRRPQQERPQLSPAAAGASPRPPERTEPVTSPTPTAVPAPTPQEPPVEVPPPSAPPPSPAPPADRTVNGALR